MAEYSRF